MKALLFIVLITVCSIADAGWYIDNVCYPDEASAAEAWNAKFPICCLGSSASANYALYLDPAVTTSVSTSGLLVTKFKAVTTSTNAATAMIQAGFQLQSCTGSSTFDATTGAAFWSFALAFVVGLYLFSKNIGLILSAIRRW